jgi:DNA repair exonuclease SbcCD ATPase subunit
MTRELITKLKDALRDIIERRDEVARRGQTIEEAVITRLGEVNRLQAAVTELTASNASLSQQLVEQKQQVVDANKMVRHVAAGIGRALPMDPPTRACLPCVWCADARSAGQRAAG